MAEINKNWQVDIEGEIHEIDTETLKKWISEKRVFPSNKVRRDSLRWIEISNIPILMECFQKSITENQFEISAANARRRFKDSKSKTEKSTSLFITLIVSALISTAVGIGWVMYSNQRDRNQAVDSSDSNSSIQISSLKAYEENEERIKQISQPDYKPAVITKKSTMDLGCYYWLNEAARDEEQAKTNLILNEHAAQQTGEPYDARLKPSPYHKKFEECVAEEKTNKANSDAEAKARKISIEKTLLENRENLRRQIKSDNAYKFLMAFGLSFLILSGVSSFRHLKSKPYN